MEKIRGKTLKEWKDYCKSDNVPIKTMKYITCLEERIEALNIPVVVKSFYCHDKKGGDCNALGYKQCEQCKEHELEQ